MLPKGTTSGDEKEAISRERSPIYHSDKIRSPVLLLHGASDKVCPIKQARLFVQSVKVHGGDVKIVEVEDEGHGLGSRDSAHESLD